MHTWPVSMSKGIEKCSWMTFQSPPRRAQTRVPRIHALHLAFGVGATAVAEHAAAGQLAADVHVQLVGLEEAFALAELEAALPVRAVLRHA